MEIKEVSKYLLNISRTVDDAGGIECVADLIQKMVQGAYSCIEILGKTDAYQSLGLLLKSLPLQPEEWRPVLHKKS